jgi:hypothetical protein
VQQQQGAGPSARPPLMCFGDFLLVAVAEGAILAAHLSPNFRLAFLSRCIVPERSSPSRVRFAAPNNGAPLTAPGRSEKPFLIREKGLQ